PVIGLGSHLQRVVLPSDRTQERALVRLAGNNRRLAALAPFRGTVKRAEIKFSFQVLWIVAMAGQAFGRQDLADLSKWHGRCGACVSRQEQREKERNARTHDYFPMDE